MKENEQKVRISILKKRETKRESINANFIKRKREE